MVKRETEIVERITYNDLSSDLKVLVVLGWIFVVLIALAFLVGFFTELLAPTV